MKKQELVSKIAESSKISKSAASLVVKSITEEIASSLAKGENVNIYGFGTFKVAQRKAREGRNPSTGARINIPAKKATVFVAGKTLKNTLKS